MQLGANYLGDGKCNFMVWAPMVENISLHIINPSESTEPMLNIGDGYYFFEKEGIEPGVTTYFYQLNNIIDRPDPATKFQPLGVHGPSMVIDNEIFNWTDSKWNNIPIEKLIIYELHVGTFTPEGTFISIIPKLDYLIDLGINAIELLPVNQFSGKRNWGYDGVCPFAVHNIYGMPDDFKTLINACHEKGIAVIMDTVYNHLGPEGNYLPEFGPYLNPIYKTPWGFSINFDSAHSDEVRKYYIEHALYWQKYFHIDGMRQDAAHLVYDLGVTHIWQDIISATKIEADKTGKPFYMFAETSRNDIKFIKPISENGLGFDGQWLDDFHHALHTQFVPEKGGYYADFGPVEDLLKAFKAGFVISGQYSEYRKKKMGSSSDKIDGEKFIVFAQNHDQVGNRPGSSRLSSLLNFAQLKLIAAFYLLSPYIPMLFMGEEYGETSPFHFFTDHQDAELQEAVRKGRKAEYADQGIGLSMADPGEETTFLESKLNWDLQKVPENKKLLDWYKTLIFFRKNNRVLQSFKHGHLEINILDENIIFWEREYHEESLKAFFNFSSFEKVINLNSFEGMGLHKILDSHYEKWQESFLPISIAHKKEIMLKPYQVLILSVST